MSLVLDGTKGIVFPSANTQSDAALITAGGTIAGNLTLGGNLTFNAGTNGITFNNTNALQNSSLNDYETGTFNPQITTNGTAFSGVTQGGNGYYTKIGNMVIVQGYAQLVGNAASGTGDAYLSNLPFITPGVYNGVGLIETGRITITTGYSYQAFLNPNTNNAIMGYAQSNTTESYIPASAINGQNNCYVSFTFTYRCTY